MTKVKDITNYLESVAPLAYQESYDNTGLIVGDAAMEVTGVLVSLDCTEEVVLEAIKQGCNMVVAHHPIVFSGLKKFNGKNYVERAVILAIKNDIALYASHTNLDSVVGGVNYKIAEKLGLERLKILSPKKQALTKLQVFVPKENTEVLKTALFEAGAGQIGNYDHCSFSVLGTGTFRPNTFANPHIGQANVDENVQEHSVEVVFSTYLTSRVLSAMRAAHPYEEVAHYLFAIENENQVVGSGIVGYLKEALSATDFLKYLKEKMELKVIKHTAFLGKNIQKIAVCGGAGGFLLNDAIGQTADVFITADYKYHEYFDADKRITICDIGHFESEVFTKDLLCSILSKKFTTFAVLNSDTHTNPIAYYF